MRAPALTPFSTGAAIVRSGAGREPGALSFAASPPGASKVPLQRAWRLCKGPRNNRPLAVISGNVASLIWPESDWCAERLVRGATDAWSDDAWSDSCVERLLRGANDAETPMGRDTDGRCDW